MRDAALAGARRSASPHVGGPLHRVLRRAPPFLGGRGRTPVDLVYHPGYELPLSGLAFNARRAALILSFLEEERLVTDDQVHLPRRASWRDLRRVHDDGYLDSLRDPAVVGAIIGVPVRGPESDRVLELERLMTGGTLLATRLARRRRGVAVNLGGGFHHAQAARGAAFCIFHDLAAAVAELRAAGDASRILIVDLDLHDGDGSRALFADDERVHTYSVHNRHWSAPGGERDTAIELAGEIGDEAYLATVRETLPPLVESFAPELAFYVAGADPAADDAIGNWDISAAAMLERDQLVLELLRPAAAKAPPPVIVVLGGGYGPHGWRYSARFLAWLLSGQPVEPPETEDLTLRLYRRAARHLPPAELAGAAGDEDWGLTAADLGAVSGAPEQDDRFLGYYSASGLELALERLGFLDRLRRLGYPDPSVGLDLRDGAGHTLRVWSGPDERELLVELRARRDRGTVAGLELLAIEWLLLQNPRGRFSDERPPLPGQKSPGLGLAGDVMALLVLVCDRLKLDGIVFVPSQFHLAVQGRSLVRFLHPEHEALFRTLAETLAPLGLAAATRAVADGRVDDAITGEPFVWPVMPMVLPVSEALRSRLEGETYDRAVQAAGPYRFTYRDPPPVAPPRHDRRRQPR